MFEWVQQLEILLLIKESRQLIMFTLRFDKSGFPKPSPHQVQGYIVKMERFSSSYSDPGRFRLGWS